MGLFGVVAARAGVRGRVRWSWAAACCKIVAADLNKKHPTGIIYVLGCCL